MTTEQIMETAREKMESGDSLFYDGPESASESDGPDEDKPEDNDGDETEAHDALEDKPREMRRGWGMWNMSNS